MSNLVLAITGATGAFVADLLLAKSPWPVSLVASDWGQDVLGREGLDLRELAGRANYSNDDHDLTAPIASGSVPTAGMVILPCSANTLAKVAHGISDTLITRAAHCHLKERRPLILCVRETPWSLIDLNNAAAVASAGGIIMPMSPPFYQPEAGSPDLVSAGELYAAYVDRVLALLGHPAPATWEDRQ